MSSPNNRPKPKAGFKKGKQVKASNKAGKKQTQAQTTIVEITGLKQSDEKEAISLIKQKATSPIIVRESHWDEGSLYLKLNSPSQAYITTKLSGIRVGGQPIKIEFFFPKIQSKKAPDTIEVLTKLIQQRYDSATKFLNLDNLIDDADFKSTKFSFSSYKFGPVLCRLIKDLCPGVATTN